VASSNSSGSQSYLKRLPRHAAFNVVGLLLPLPIGLLTFPGLIERLGVEQFGLLALVWMLIGYFSLFDLGIARALTKAITDIDCEDYKGAASIVSTGMTLIVMLGIVGAILVAAIGYLTLAANAELASTTAIDYSITVTLVAAAIPVVLATAGWRAIFEAHHEFEIVNYLRVPIGIYNYVAPWAVTFVSTKLSASVAVIVLGRIAFLLVHRSVMILKHSSILVPFPFDRKVAVRLVKYGGWLTVTNIVSPLLVYLDRFLVAAVLSSAAVTFYVTPYEIAARVLVVPAALAGVLFPALTKSFVDAPESVRSIFSISTGLSFFFLLMVALAGVALSELFFEAWLGREFVDQSSRVFQILLVGVVINGVARIPFTLIQAVGRPDLTAKLHLIEFPVYVGILVLLLTTSGIIGAAVAWVLRVMADFIGMLYVSAKLVPSTRKSSVKICFLVFLSIPFCEYISNSEIEFHTLLLAIGFLALNAILVWFRYFDAEDRSRLKSIVHKQYV